MGDHHHVTGADVRDDGGAGVVCGFKDKSLKKEGVASVFGADAPDLAWFATVGIWELEGDANGVTADSAMGVFDCFLLHGWLGLKD
jgi:hypothetical protein